MKKYYNICFSIGEARWHELQKMSKDEYKEMLECLRDVVDAFITKEFDKDDEELAKKEIEKQFAALRGE